MYISGSALAAAAIQQVQGGNGKTLLALAGNDVKCITAEIMDRAARQGDALSRQVFDRMGTVLGIGLSNLINIFSPQLVILGGLVCRASDFFLPACIETVRRRAWHASPKSVRVSHLRNGAMLGAAALVLQQLFSTGQIV
jgi:glucokinase